METVQCDVLVIGAGVIGLAVAARLDPSLTTAVVEANQQFGQETSSRNSEVIHSGIYYPLNSKKTEWCIRGKALLYEYCERHNVPFVRTGKIVVATEPAEEAFLEKMDAHCRTLNVPHEWITGDEVQTREPLVRARRGLLFPGTGIVDSHQFMARLEHEFVERGGFLAYRHRVMRFESTGSQWKTFLQGPDGELCIESPHVVNAAGLAAAELSNLALGTSRYEHRYCRGRYFTLSQSYQGKFRHLVYPCPPKDGLGVHVTVDTQGFARLGPDVDWCLGVKYEGVRPLYDCDWEALRPSFLAAAQRYCPTIRENEVLPSQIGIRPKLFLDGAAAPDFLVERRGSFIHCLGIESPGLTASLAIADEVARLVKEA